MATTTPDNIRTPSPSDPYNLVSDLAILGSDVQTALNRRANSYIGTAAQRTAFTTAPEGVHWQDTDGSKDYWARRGGGWVPVAPNIGVANVRSGSVSIGTTITNVTFASPFPAGTTPNVVCNVASGSGGAIGRSVLVTSRTNTGFSARLSGEGGPYPVSYIAAA